MKNKFSALAQDKYMDFLLLQHLYVAGGYLILILLFALVLYPYISVGRGILFWMPRLAGFVLAGLGSLMIHGFFTLRLVMTRPYFLDDAKFGHWYYEVLDLLPESTKPAVFLLLFTAFPLLVVGYACYWYFRKLNRTFKITTALGVLLLGLLIFWQSGVFSKVEEKAVSEQKDKKWNVIIIGSDSLRGDKIGFNGYRPWRSDGLAAAGVSPRIDELASRSVNFERCYTPIASTLEAGTSLMVSQYPHTHGLRHMYPNRETVDKTKASTTPIASLLQMEGYDTAAIGDWCAGYYELMPLGFEHVSVSSFDNFKIYMSQAVVMAHFSIPLYFDHPIGYKIFPQLGSFAQFVTPEVVTNRVKKRLSEVAESERPFFWHVFYSCNHLPYRNPEPYSSMFTDPDYSGPNKSGVDFNIDAFIGGTDLENKWLVLPEKEVTQIRGLYDGCTRLFDENVGEILDALEQSGLSENTIVIVTADHGDNLYEEGVTLGHGLTFNGGLQANHVPLVFYLPGQEARSLGEQVNIIDIIPTVAELLEIEKPANWEGKSFASWLTSAQEPVSRAFYGETGFPFIQFKVEGIERPPLPPMDQMTGIEDSFNYQFVLKDEFEKPLVDAKQRCLVTDKWKLICTPTLEGGRHFGLFKRAEDGLPEVDIADQYPEVLAAMKVALERWMDERMETSIGEIFPEGE
ncbi:MAG: sulfatase [Akkermansiaceae bacterium]